MPARTPLISLSSCSPAYPLPPPPHAHTPQSEYHGHLYAWNEAKRFVLGILLDLAEQPRNRAPIIASGCADVLCACVHSGNKETSACAVAVLSLLCQPPPNTVSESGLVVVASSVVRAPWVCSERDPIAPQQPLSLLADSICRLL
jgi:hypothetical protein